MGWVTVEKATWDALPAGVRNARSGVFNGVFLNEPAETEIAGVVCYIFDDHRITPDHLAILDHLVTRTSRGTDRTADVAVEVAQRVTADRANPRVKSSRVGSDGVTGDRVDPGERG